MEGGDGEKTWFAVLQQLVDAGDVDGAISFLEAKRETIESSCHDDRELACVLDELLKLHSSKGLSHKADEAHSRISMIDLRSQPNHPTSFEDQGRREEQAEDPELIHRIDVSRGASANVVNLKNEDSADQACAEAGEEEQDDDWEAAADRSADELLSRSSVPESAKASSDHDSAVQTCKRRGRGRFTYRRYGDYRDSFSDSESPRTNPDSEIGDVTRNLENTEISSSRRSEVPRERPQTSVSTATRLIAHGLGQKLPATSSRSKEFKLLEEARKSRIIRRQKARDDAWGSDEEKH